MFIKDKHICMGCMKILQNDERCDCGFDEEFYKKKDYWLPLGTILDNNLVVGKVIGEGGFGITYVGLDINLEMKVAIKEFFLGGHCNRDSFVTSEVFSNGATYYKYKEKFVNEAKIIYKLKDEPNVVSVNRFFESNNTAYIVMDFIDGVTLKEHIKVKKNLSFKETVKIFRPLLSTLERIHKSNIYHRDISPDNIILAKNNKPILIDFGSARKIHDKEKKTTGMVKMGYSPIELYKGGVIGPFTDIFSICATMFTCLTGEVPHNYEGDDFVDIKKLDEALTKSKCSPEVSALIKKGMSLKAEDRFQNISELNVEIDAILVPTGIVVCPSCGKEVKSNTKFCPKCGRQVGTIPSILPPVPPPVRKDRSLLYFVIAAVICVATVIGIWLLLRDSNGSTSGPTTSTPPVASESTTTVTLTPTPGTQDGEYGSFAEAYADKISSIKEQNPKAVYGLVNITEDDIPELFYTSGEGETSTVSFATFIEGKVIELGNVGSFGGCYIYPQKGRICVQTSNNGEENISFYSYTNKRLKDDKTFSIEQYVNDDNEMFFRYLVNHDSVGSLQRYAEEKREQQRELRELGGAARLINATNYKVSEFDEEVFEKDASKYNITNELDVNPYFDYDITYPGEKKSGDSETGLLIENFMNKSGVKLDSIRMMDIGKYDIKSGAYGAFIFEGAVGEDNMYLGNLWYVSLKSEPEIIEENVACTEFSGNFTTQNGKKYKFINIKDEKNHLPVSYIYSVEDSVVEKDALSGWGEIEIPDGTDMVKDFTINVASSGKYNGQWEYDTPVATMPYYCYVDDEGTLKGRNANYNHSTATLNADVGYDILRDMGIYIDANGVDHNDFGIAIYRIVDWGNGIWSVHYYKYAEGYKCFEVVNYDKNNKCYLNFTNADKPSKNTSLLFGVYKNNITEKGYPIDVNGI